MNQSDVTPKGIVVGRGLLARLFVRLSHAFALSSEWFVVLFVSLGDSSEYLFWPVLILRHSCEKRSIWTQH